VRAEQAVVRQACLAQKGDQILGGERDRHVSQPEAQVLESGHAPRQVEGEAQVGDLQLQALDPSESPDISGCQTQQALAFDEGKSECALGVVHNAPVHPIVEQLGAASTGTMD
jgi:hypothetical protein